MSDALHLKRPKTELKAWQLEIAWRLDWLISSLFRTKRKLSRYSAKAAYTKTEISNKKIKADLKTSFLDIHHYISEIAKLY